MASSTLVTAQLGTSCSVLNKAFLKKRKKEKREKERKEKKEEGSHQGPSLTQTKVTMGIIPISLSVKIPQTSPQHGQKHISMLLV